MRNVEIGEEREGEKVEKRSGEDREDDRSSGNLEKQALEDAIIEEL